MGPRAGMDECGEEKIACTHRGSKRSARTKLLYPLSFTKPLDSDSQVVSSLQLSRLKFLIACMQATFPGHLSAKSN